MVSLIGRGFFSNNETPFTRKSLLASMALLGLIIAAKLAKEIGSIYGLEAKVERELLKALPKNHISHWVGEIVHQRVPGVLGRMTVEWFAKYYGINMDEAERPMSEYRSIGELFTRNLKAGTRPIQNGVVHPVDGRITQWGVLKNNIMIQAKGKAYQCSELLKSKEWAETLEGGSYFTYYLCPTDYHQIHSPVTGEVVEAKLIPGKLWPVNDWSVNSIESLFPVNERIVTYIRTDKGTCALVMVGATNVGKMTVSYDRDLISNQLGDCQELRKTYGPGRALKKGDKLGIFHMGSTVVMIYPKGFLELAKSDPSGPAKLGETLGV